MADIFHYLWSFFVVLTVIVFVHEFGHYIIAKWCGVRIEAFSIGFGKELAGFTDKSGTRWKLCLLPLGGYVKMFGDADAASSPDHEKSRAMSEDERNHAFIHKPLWKKAAIVAAGPVFNFLLTIAILTGILMTSGMPTSTPVVGQVLENSAAQEAGILAGDYIEAVDGVKVKTFGDIPRLITINTGQPVQLSVKRGDEHFTLALTPRMTESKDAFGNKVMIPLIGLRSEVQNIKELNFFHAVGEATKRTYDICALSLKGVGQIITGQRDASELKGPIGIAKLSGQATETDYITLLWFIAMLSANLGFVNLLPIPVLDGGHLMFYAVEAVTRRQLAEKVMNVAFRAGFAILIALMAFTIFNDLRAIF